MSELVEHQAAFSQDVAKLLQHAAGLGLAITLGEAWRTVEQEQWDVAHGLSQTMQSNHLRRLAIDINVFRDGQLVECPAELGAFWKGLCPLNRWGGDFQTLRDYPHFERNAP